MANPVDVVIGSEAIKQVQNLVNQLNLADAELLKLSQTALQAGKNISGISTPKGFNDSLANNAKISQDLDKLNTKYNSLHENIVKKAEQSRLAEIRLRQAREKAFDSFEKNAQKEQSIVEKNNNTYNRTQQQINKLTVAYNDLATRKERYNNLSVNEEMRLKTLTAINEKYNNVLKTVDATGGKHFRNVGNYASGYNALGNSINQLTREMPAFANSIQTGLMAISNNFAALQDSIRGIIAQNRILASEGKPTVSVFKQLAGAAFSWTTFLSIAVTLLTVYGAKIIETISGSKAKKESLEKEKKALEEKTKAEERDRDVIASRQSEEITRSTLLFQTAKNVTLTYSERSKAIKELKERYPDYLKGISDEKILAGEASEAEEKLNKALVNRGLALASQQMLQESITDSLKNEKRLSDELNDIQEKRTKILKDFKGVEGQEFSQNEKVQKKLEERNLQLQRLFYLESTVNDQYRDRKSLIQQDITFFTKQYNENAKYLDVVRETTKEDKKSTDAKNRKLEALDVEAKSIGTTIEQMDKYNDMLETELILNAGNETAYKNIKTALEQVKQAKTDLITGGGEIISTANLKEVSIAVVDVSKKLTELQQQYLESFSSEFFQNSGFSETFDMLNGEIDGFGENFSVTFNAIAESAQEAFNFISGISQQSFDAERNRLQNQYDVAIGFANGNKAAEEKLATDLEKKKKEIANREAKAKQKQAIFNISIDTAQAIMGLWAKPGFPAAIPLAIAVGALGAVQIGLVAAQKIPQYAEGTDNHSGGLMLVNDAKGSSYQEKIILPNGKEIMPQGRNVLMDAPAGTKVLTPEQQLMQALNGTNINLSKETINRSQGMTAEQMDYVLGKHFGNITTNTMIFDENGMRTWSEKNGNKTIKTNNRVTRTGIRV